MGGWFSSTSTLPLSGLPSSPTSRIVAGGDAGGAGGAGGAVAVHYAVRSGGLDAIAARRSEEGRVGFGFGARGSPDPILDGLFMDSLQRDRGFEPHLSVFVFKLVRDHQRVLR